MITSEEARKSIGNTDYLSCHLMADYIAQQEKVNELLELYRLKDKLQDDKMLATPKRRTSTSHVKIAEINNKIYDVKQKIEKLWNELK